MFIFEGAASPPPRARAPPFPRACIHAHTHIQLQLTSDVENFPGYAEAVSGPDLMEDLRKQAEVSYIRTTTKGTVLEGKFFFGGGEGHLASLLALRRDQFPVLLEGTLYQEKQRYVGGVPPVLVCCVSCSNRNVHVPKRSRPKCLPALNKRTLLCSFPAAALRHRDDVPGRDLGGPFRKTVPGFGAEAGFFCQVRDPARGKLIFRFAVLLDSRARVHTYIPLSSALPFSVFVAAPFCFVFRRCLERKCFVPGYPAPCVYLHIYRFVTCWPPALLNATHC